MVEPTLIDAVKKREPNAFKQMYEGTIHYVYTIVSRYVANPSDHQDVIQEIYAQVFLRIESYEAKKGAFKYWLRRITINHCIDQYHKNRKEIQREPLEIQSYRLADSAKDPGALTKEELLMFLKKMPGGYKEIFMLVVIDDYSHQEVGEMLNISPETSRSQLHRAKKWLKQNLSNETLNLMASGL